MSAAARLYTPELLALAVELAKVPPLDAADAQGEARSPTCGSTLAIDLALDGNGRIIGLGAITETLRQLESWLGGQGEMPDWPDLAIVAPARLYPARHGAMLLPWKAAHAALSPAPAAG